MIPVGTLCLLVNGHELEGKTCAVAGPLEFMYVRGIDGSFGNLFCYDIDVDVPVPEGCHGWAAMPCELIPIAPPFLDVSRETSLHEPA